MKRIIGFLLIGLCTVVRGSDASDVVSDASAPYTSRGVSITKWVDGASLTFTNDALEPWYPVSLASVNGYTNDLTFTVKRVYGVTNQYATSGVTTTNFIGQVVTNDLIQVTNVFYRVYTGTIYSVTASNAAPVALEPAFQIKVNDVVEIGQSDTNAKPIIINGQR